MSRPTPHPTRAALLLVAAALGCSAPVDTPVSITFAARVGGEPFACGGTYDGVGTSATELTALDFRFYLHDVRLVGEDGAEIPVALEDDGTFSDGEVALIDFEDGGACDGGNAPTNVVLRGTIPVGSPSTFRGLRFRLGVPTARNHLDNATAPAPLNLSSMYWGWNDGYKFIRVEARTTGRPGGVLLHLGATGCTGSAPAGTRVCARTNVGEIEVAGDLDPASDVVVADLASLFSTLDLDVDGGGDPGCMSAPDDPECTTLLPRLGVGGDQALFRIEAE